MILMLGDQAFVKYKWFKQIGFKLSGSGDNTFFLRISCCSNDLPFIFYHSVYIFYHLNM